MRRHLPQASKLIGSQGKAHRGAISAPLFFAHLIDIQVTRPAGFMPRRRLGSSSMSSTREQVEKSGRLLPAPIRRASTRLLRPSATPLDQPPWRMRTGRYASTIGLAVQQEQQPGPQPCSHARSLPAPGGARSRRLIAGHTTCFGSTTRPPPRRGPAVLPTSRRRLCRLWPAPLEHGKLRRQPDRDKLGSTLARSRHVPRELIRINRTRVGRATTGGER